MKTISLIIPTRERESKFKNTIEALQINTFHKNRIELIIIVNEDDPATQEYVKRIMGHYGMLKYKLLIRPYSQMLNEDFYNYGGQHATGDLLWIFADDLMACAPSWDIAVDTAIENAFKKYPDGIFCLGILDNTKPPSHLLPKFPCFPMFTRQAMVAQGGWLLLPKIPCWGVDFIIYKIYHGLDRLVWLDDRNYLNHVSHHTHQCQPDNTAIRIGATFNLLKMRPEFNTDLSIANDVPVVIEQLRNKINEFKPSV